jgi:anti-sigma-K factor RskA
MARLPSAQKRTFGPLPRFRGQFSVGQFVTAVVMVILLGLNLFAAIQIRDLQIQQVALAERLSTEQTAIALLAYPSTQVLAVNADVQDLTGSMLVDKDKTTAVLFLWNLPGLETGLVYQIWLIDADGKRVSGGLFTSAGGQDYTTAFIQSSIPFNQFIAIGVTIEPSGGSEQPTGSRLLFVEL